MQQWELSSFEVNPKPNIPLLYGLQQALSATCVYLEDFRLWHQEERKSVIASVGLELERKKNVSCWTLESNFRVIWREVVQEGKERRRQWAQRKIQFKSDKESVPEAEVEAPAIRGMLPSNIVNLLAAREKQTFASDSEEEVVNHKPANLKKKQKSSGSEIVLLEEIPPAQCLENSMEFLKRRKMKVSRSNSVLINAKQALRLLSTPGNLLSKG